jgi:hypothetical protein
MVKAILLANTDTATPFGTPMRAGGDSHHDSRQDFVNELTGARAERNVVTVPSEDVKVTRKTKPPLKAHALPATA